LIPEMLFNEAQQKSGESCFGFGGNCIHKSFGEVRETGTPRNAYFPQTRVGTHTLFPQFTVVKTAFEYPRDPLKGMARGIYENQSPHRPDKSFNGRDALLSVNFRAFRGPNCFLESDFQFRGPRKRIKKSATENRVATFSLFRGFDPVGRRGEDADATAFF